MRTEGEQAADQVSVDIINLWTSNTTRLLEKWIPPPIRKTVQGPEKRPSQGPKNDRNDPEKIPSPRHTYSKHILQKNWSKMIICGLSSGQTNLHPPIWGHGRQLDDWHRHPNINIREIIWLGNQLSIAGTCSLYGNWSTSSHSSSSPNDGMTSEWQKRVIPGSFGRKYARMGGFSSLSFRLNSFIRRSFWFRMTIEWRKKSF